LRFAKALSELSYPFDPSAVSSGAEAVDYERRRRRPITPLSDESLEMIDDVYGVDEASGGCVICPK
jgi:hypothetical protein